MYGDSGLVRCWRISSSKPADGTGPSLQPPASPHQVSQTMDTGVISIYPPFPHGSTAATMSRTTPRETFIAAMKHRSGLLCARLHSYATLNRLCSTLPPPLILEGRSLRRRVSKNGAGGITWNEDTKKRLLSVLWQVSDFPWQPGDSLMAL